MSNLEHYQSVVSPALVEKFGYKNPHQIPSLESLHINIGSGEAAHDKKVPEVVSQALELISGQKPIITLARRSEAGFKIRTGWPVGCKVTLRGKRMYDFIHKLVSIVLPRVRDFRGLNPRSFDGRGNFSFGITEHIVFPEIDFDKVDKMLGMDISINTTATSDDEARELLKLMKFPFTTKRSN
ncbi:MAG: 50S ribosomal protein L5 [Legionellales bacterium]|nr:50S ribosomal protein L5 [Legionellales bacterium]|tara:strand:- start:1278 stop:1826 length:549 start_codon:yes stop_codon:yes gene_type:complete